MFKTHSTSALNTDAVEKALNAVVTAVTGVGRLLVASDGPLGVADTVSAGIFGNLLAAANGSMAILVFLIFKYR